MPTWKKVIVSGSTADLTSVTASLGLRVGTNQVIGTTQAATRLTGSFSGDGAGLTGVTATFPATDATTGLISTDKFFVNEGGTNKSLTYQTLLGDLAGTNLAVEGSDSLALATTLTGLTSIAVGTVTATSVNSTQITGSSFLQTGTSGVGFNGTASYALVAANAGGGNLKISGSTNGSPLNGTIINLDAETLALNGTANQVNTTVTDNTITIGFPTNVTMPGNLTVAQNLTVNGTVTTINTANLVVEDRFILLGSSSSPTNTDGGIIVSAVGVSPISQSGYAFMLDGTGPGNPRWGVSASVSQYATTNVTPSEYTVTARQASGAPVTDPFYGGNSLGYGNVYVNSADESIWIFS